MFGSHLEDLDKLKPDQDELEIRRLIDSLIGEVAHVKPTAKIRDAATMALYYGRRMGLAGPEAFEALAALCLILGDRRSVFFSNLFVTRLLSDRALKPREKLHRLIEMILGNRHRAAV